MKAPNFLSPSIAFILKLVGLILVVIVTLDFIILLTGAKFQDNQWVVQFTNQMVDRGAIPLVGLALLLTGSWIDAAFGSSGSPRTSLGMRWVALILATILGISYLLVVPWSVNATRMAADEQVKKIAQEASNAEKQLDTQVEQFKGQLDQQLSLTEQAINSGQLQGDQLEQARKQQEQLKKLQSDPKALEAQVAPARKQELDRIQARKRELETQTQGDAMRAGMRIGLNSLLLAIGFTVIGWTGLRQMRYSQPSQPSDPI